MKALKEKCVCVGGGFLSHKSHETISHCPAGRLDVPLRSALSALPDS